MRGFGKDKKSKKIKISNIPSQPSQEQLINQAFTYHSQGNIQEAAKYYQHFINQGFKDHRVFSNYGTILKNLGQLKEAEKLYQQAIQLKPDFADAHSNLGNLLRDLSKDQDAQVSLRKAIELNPNHINAHVNLGLILQTLGQLKEAEILTRKAIELKPDFVDAHYNLGIILRDQGKLEEAELVDRKGIDIDLMKNIDSKFKEKYLKNIPLSKSQFRQDLFALTELNFKSNGFFVEFGSCDGFIGSNSYILEKFFNWNGILAEPAKCWHKKLKKNRLANIETKCVWKSSDEEISFHEPYYYKQMSSIDNFSDTNKDCFEEGKRYTVKTISLLDLLDKNEAPRDIDYLSIDTEGSEYEILKNFNFHKYKFRVITCEHNFNPIREKIYHLLISKGYKRKFETISRVDDWYVFSE
mgnify:CR=1 FL=1